MNKAKIHKILEDAAQKVFNESLVDGDYFKSLEFRVELESDRGGFETVIVFRSKEGFFEDTGEEKP